MSSNGSEGFACAPASGIEYINCLEYLHTEGVRPQEVHLLVTVSAKSHDKYQERQMKVLQSVIEEAAWRSVTYLPGRIEPILPFRGGLRLGKSGPLKQASVGRFKSSVRSVLRQIPDLEGKTLVGRDHYVQRYLGKTAGMSGFVIVDMGVSKIRDLRDAPMYRAEAMGLTAYGVPEWRPSTEVHFTAYWRIARHMGATYIPNEYARMRSSLLPLGCDPDLAWFVGAPLFKYGERQKLLVDKIESVLSAHPGNEWWYVPHPDDRSFLRRKQGEEFYRLLNLFAGRVLMDALPVELLLMTASHAFPARVFGFQSSALVNVQAMAGDVIDVAVVPHEIHSRPAQIATELLEVFQEVGVRALGVRF